MENGPAAGGSSFKEAKCQGPDTESDLVAANLVSTNATTSSKVILALDDRPDLTCDPTLDKLLSSLSLAATNESSENSPCALSKNPCSTLRDCNDVEQQHQQRQQQQQPLICLSKVKATKKAVFISASV